MKTEKKICPQYDGETGLCRLNEGNEKFKYGRLMAGGRCSDNMIAAGCDSCKNLAYWGIREAKVLTQIFDADDGYL